MKFVAEVSSSIKSKDVPYSRASATFAACEVLPLAFSVEKAMVSFFPGKLLINPLIFTFSTFLPSSARIFTASVSEIMNSRPS